MIEMPRYLEISFRDGKALGAYLYLRPIEDGAVARSEERGGGAGGIVVDFARDGTPLGIEITSPATFSVDVLNAVLAELGEPPAGDGEIAPLLAA
jgi:hypothetical protein